jgi:iron complex transport system permease protein
VIGAAALGALALGVADLIGRVVLAPRDVPAGLMTALFGAPYFLWLLRRVGR